jgi:hypothetical protein
MWEDNIHVVLTLRDFIKEGKITLSDFLTKRHGVCLKKVRHYHFLRIKNSSNPYSFIE